MEAFYIKYSKKTELFQAIAVVSQYNEIYDKSAEPNFKMTDNTLTFEVHKESGNYYSHVNLKP